MNRPFEILLVEDSVTDAKLTVRVLKKHGLADKLKWVKNGADAMDFILARGAYASRNPSRLPKLILLDIALPMIDGLQVLENLKLRPHLSIISVVVMTASKVETDRLKSEKLGVNAYLEKPVDEGNFIRVVKEIELYGYFFGSGSAAC